MSKQKRLLRRKHMSAILRRDGFLDVGTQSSGTTEIDRQIYIHAKEIILARAVSFDMQKQNTRLSC